MKKAVIASLVFVFALGCKKGPVVVVKDPGPAQLPAGTQLAESSDKAVSIAIASGWKQGGPDSFTAPSLGDMMGSMGGDMQSMTQGSPSAGESAMDAETAADLEKKGILIWVNDSTKPIPGEERTHYRIKRTDNGPMSLEDAAAEAKEGLINEGPIQYVELPIGKAARLEAKNTKIDGGELFQVVYVVVNGEHVYNIRFTTQNGAGVIQGVEKDVINSLRIKPAPAS